jgi:hypothetical protein
LFAKLVWTRPSESLVAASENLLQKQNQQKPAAKDSCPDRKNRIAEKPLNFTAEEFLKPSRP